MKRFVMLALTICVASTLGLAVASGTSAAPKEASPFVGQWEAIDVFDDSYMQMKITGHHQPNHVKLVDDWASACPEEGPATLIGKVTYSDAVLMEMDSRVRCHMGNDQWDGSGWLELIDPDLLTDEWGNLWTRM
jgi:hypothetical protein